MSNRISWAASPETDVVSYTIERADAALGTWAAIATVANDTAGANYDADQGLFFYSDATGTPTHWYRMFATDEAGQSGSPSPPFQARDPAVPGPAVVPISADTGGPGNLRYQTRSGLPIENAYVRVYQKVDYDLRRFNAPLAVTQTVSNGTWKDVVFLPPGFTYVVHFQRDGLYGPDHVEIVV